ncbi:MAG: sulfurtransferase TusA family protein [bacterium]|nr:sulfurtransferase TusA family protein [bacterium]
MNEVVHQLNARRLLCPLPVIRTQDAVNRLQIGDKLLVIATDPGVMHDIPAWCRIHGHAVLTTETIENEIHLLIQVGRK